MNHRTTVTFTVRNFTVTVSLYAGRRGTSLEPAEDAGFSIDLVRHAGRRVTSRIEGRALEILESEVDAALSARVSA